MINELIGITEEEFTDFLIQVEKSHKRNPYYVKLKKLNPEVYITSLTVEKYLNSILKESFGNLLIGHKNKYGAFAGNSIYTQIEHHRKFDYILKMDIQNFFESLRWFVIEAEIKKIGLDQEHMNLIKKVYFYNGYLARGLKNSSILAEYCLIRIDNWLSSQFKKTFRNTEEYHYSRYYDDFFISTNSKDDLSALKERLKQYIKKYDLTLNFKKSKIVKVNNTKILGLSFSNGEIYPPRKLKQLIYEYTSEYEYLPEEDLDTVRAKLSMCGTIKGQNHYIVNNSSVPSQNHIDNIKYYSDELSRLNEKRNRFNDQLKH